MATLRLCISISDKKWSAIIKKIQEHNSGKKVSVRGDGITQFISSEIRKKFSKDPEANCNDISARQTVKKFFTIDVSDEIMRKIACEAKLDEVGISTLITKTILAPLIEVAQH